MADGMQVDVAILGAGPAGLTAACACQDHGLSFALLDCAGLGQSFVEYPQTLRFFSPPDEMEIGGVPLPAPGGEKPTREQYLAYLRAVVRARNIPLFTWESVAECHRHGERWQLRTRLEPAAGEGRLVDARAVVLATGVWHEPIRLGIPGADRPNVFSEFHEPTAFMGHDVLVVGNGNSSVGAALSLMEARARVTLSTRRPPHDYRCGLRPFVKRDLDFAVQEGKVLLRDSTFVTEIGPTWATLRPVRYRGAEEFLEGSSRDYEPAGESYRIPCRFVFALLGHRADTRFLSEVLRLPLRPDGRPEADPGSWETALPRVYLAGSLADPAIDIVLRLREQTTALIAAIARAR